uniref:Uncharacterized protein n=1 Tax=Glossina morsitans morsitans TaxID=37546 RepID=A0A1B0G9V0_GLOMM
MFVKQSRSRSSFATNTATSKLTSSTTTTTTTTTTARIPREQNIANTGKTITNVSDYQIRRLHIIANKPRAISVTRRGIKSITTPRTFTTTTILETLKFCVPNTIKVPETATTLKSQLNCLATKTKLLRVPSKRTTTTNDKIFVLRQQETQHQQNICHWLQLPSFQILLWILFTLLLLTKTTKANNNNIPVIHINICRNATPCFPVTFSVENASLSFVVKVLTATYPAITVIKKLNNKYAKKEEGKRKRRIFLCKL